jgi:hypothetical protein
MGRAIFKNASRAILDNQGLEGRQWSNPLVGSNASMSRQQAYLSWVAVFMGVVLGVTFRPSVSLRIS